MLKQQNYQEFKIFYYDDKYLEIGKRIIEKNFKTVKILKDLDVDIKDKNVLIVEDIIDSGITLRNLYDTLMTREPRSLKLCTLLNKPARKKVDVNVDYVGFVIEDKFIVGYGIDYDEKYRNLPYIAIVEDVED